MEEIGARNEVKTFPSLVIMNIRRFLFMIRE
jgi:hypothetical protein